MPEPADITPAYRADASGAAGEGWCEAIVKPGRYCCTKARFERDGRRICGLHRRAKTITFGPAELCARRWEKGAGPCWGDVARYSFDIDLPVITLCKGHVWSMFEGAPAHVRAQVAEEVAGA